MIVCYDASASPGRNVQRMGRTGRHGEGRVVYVLAAGKEMQKYKTSLQVRAHLFSFAASRLASHENSRSTDFC